MRDLMSFAFCCLLTFFFADAGFAQKEPAVALLSRDIHGNIGGDLDEPAGVPMHSISINLSGVESWDLLDDPDNTVLTEFLGSNAVMTGIGWDVTIETVGSSWLSEAVIYFDGSDLDGSGLYLTPGIGNGFPGTMNFRSNGIVDLTDVGIANIPLGDDAALYMQFFESFDDVSDGVDALFIDSDASNTLTIVGFGFASSSFDAGVPTLGPFGFVALALIIAGAGVWHLRRQRI